MSNKEALANMLNNIKAKEEAENREMWGINTDTEEEISPESLEDRITALEKELKEFEEIVLRFIKTFGQE